MQTLGTWGTVGVEGVRAAGRRLRGHAQMARHRQCVAVSGLGRPASGRCGRHGGDRSTRWTHPRHAQARDTWQWPHPPLTQTHTRRRATRMQPRHHTRAGHSLASEGGEGEGSPQAPPLTLSGVPLDLSRAHTLTWCHCNPQRGWGGLCWKGRWGQQPSHLGRAPRARPTIPPALARTQGRWVRRAGPAIARPGSGHAKPASRVSGRGDRGLMHRPEVRVHQAAPGWAKPRRDGICSGLSPTESEGGDTMEPFQRGGGDRAGDHSREEGTGPRTGSRRESESMTAARAHPSRRARPRRPTPV